MLKRFLPLLIVLISGGTLFGQADWKYKGEVKFPDADTAYVQPYLCTVDSEGKLYVASSTVTTLNARNIIFYAEPGDTVLTKFVDYFEIGEQDSATGHVQQILGITTMGTDLLVSTKIPQFQIPGGASSAFHYEKGILDSAFIYGFNTVGSGWGTPVYGVAATPDSFAIGGIAYQGPSIRFYNFSSNTTVSGFGSYVFMSSQPMDPNGPHSSGFDMIRDVATVPTGDYFAADNVFYTSRNALSATAGNGGVTVWSGGTIEDPSVYAGQVVQDGANLLTFSDAIPYGITVHPDGKLWVAGVDSLRRWVKGFDLLGAFASYALELPSQNSFDNPNPDGAPMVAPCDVAFSPDGNTAYVVDAYAETVFMFENENSTSVRAENQTLPDGFELKQNYPNPFNPSTMISFALQKGSTVKAIVSNALGQSLEILADGYYEAGNHNIAFNGKNLASGIYYYTLTSNGKSMTKKMILMK
ncbi:MAG: hypothetical protein SCALA702_36130 [Melioribacteraceae bacterium]|nr:MAG: hypothetical protein SCALA702_36130 [Melioribacteraceae bacterium]